MKGCVGQGWERAWGQHCPQGTHHCVFHPGATMCCHSFPSKRGDPGNLFFFLHPCHSPPDGFGPALPHGDGWGAAAQSCLAPGRKGSWLGCSQPHQEHHTTSYNINGVSGCLAALQACACKQSSQHPTLQGLINLFLTKQNKKPNPNLSFLGPVGKSITKKWLFLSCSF